MKTLLAIQAILEECESRGKVVSISKVIKIIELAKRQENVEGWLKDAIIYERYLQLKAEAENV